MKIKREMLLLILKTSLNNIGCRFLSASSLCVYLVVDRLYKASTIFLGVGGGRRKDFLPLLATRKRIGIVYKALRQELIKARGEELSPIFIQIVVA